MAAAFNAPISAVLFVIEEVIGTWSAGVLGAIVLAAVSSVVTMRAFLGAGFAVSRSAVSCGQGRAKLLAYAVLGVAGGGASLVLLKWIRLCAAQDAGASAVGRNMFSRPRRDC